MIMGERLGTSQCQLALDAVCDMRQHSLVADCVHDSGPLEEDSPYNNLPPREELWDIVRETAIYLDTLLLVDADQSPVKFNALTWGRETAPGQYEVCLAGLWHLCQYGELIPASSGYETLPEPMYSIVNFIDALRWADMEADTIYKYLNVEVPHNLRYTLHSEYSSTNPYHIQLFLEWLLLQELQHYQLVRDT